MATETTLRDPTDQVVMGLEDPEQLARVRAFVKLYPALYQDLAGFAYRQGAKRTSDDHEEVARRALLDAGVPRIRKGPISHQNLWNYLCQTVRHQLVDRIRHPKAGDEVSSKALVAMLEADGLAANDAARAAHGKPRIAVHARGHTLSIEDLDERLSCENEEDALRPKCRPALEEDEPYIRVAREAYAAMRLSKDDEALWQMKWGRRSDADCDAELRRKDGWARKRRAQLRAKFWSVVQALLVDYEPSVRLDILRKLGYEDAGVSP